MTFESKYLSATRALDANAYLDATDIYLDLLMSHKDQMIEIVSEHNSALKIHIELAKHYAIRKILVQRFKGHTDISLDLSDFSKALPFQFRYDAKFCTFLSTRKNDSSSIQASRKIITDMYADFSNKFGFMQPDSESVSGDAYMVHWVIPDFLNFEGLLPANPNGYVNIGCGMGAFDSIYLNGCNHAPASILIDNNEKLRDPVEYISKLNEQSGIEFATNWQPTFCEPDTVVSIRSCAFLYDAREYDALFQRLATGSRVFLDVSHNRLDATKAYFESFGARTKLHPRFNDYKVYLLESQF